MRYLERLLPEARAARSAMRSLLAASFLLPCALLACCQRVTVSLHADTTDPEPLRVAVSVPPQAYFVERLGGARVRVEVMVPPGTGYDTYEPAPRQMVELARARLYVLVGHPGFLFEAKHVAPFLARHQEVAVVDMSSGMELIMTGEAEGRLPERGEPGWKEAREHGHAHAGGDPHVWVAPATVRVAARNISAALAALDPAGAPLYRANLAAFLAEIDALDRALRLLLSGIPSRSFLVYHPSWGYFARQYGLTQVAIEAEGREPSAARLIALIEQARREGVKVVFVQRGFSSKSAEVVAEELGGRVVAVDPLARDWPASLRQAARAFRAAAAERRDRRLAAPPPAPARHEPAATYAARSPSRDSRCHPERSEGSGWGST
jgi:zinc transport system substrate-binding protein